MSTPMVIANLNGSKNQTRRIIDPQPKGGIICDADNFKKGYMCSKIKINDNPEAFEITQLFKRKYQVGDILWVRETFTVLEPEHCMNGMPSRFIYRADCDSISEDARLDYIKSGYPYKWKPNLFMPRVACRIFLEVIEVRVERLNDISEQDAIDEGIIPLRMSRMQLASSGQLYLDYSKKTELFNKGVYPIQSYKSLWESINGKGSWDINPWVWVVKYKRIEKPENFI